MKIILKKDVKNLGRRGDVVTVKTGYFRNYLLPQGFAEFATPALLKVAEIRLQTRVQKVEDLKSQASDLHKKLDGKTITLKEKTTDKGSLYAAVSEKEIIEAIKGEFNIELDASHIDLPDHIKQLGEYKVTLKLADKISAVINLNIESL